MKALEYETIASQIEDWLREKSQVVLATTDGKRVSARTVYYFSERLKVYFVTSKAYNKYEQIQKNPYVALCMNNIQIEGIAVEKGHPLSEENKEIIGLVDEQSAIYSFFKYRNTVLFEVAISNVEMWIDGQRLFLDVAKKECFMK